MAKKTKTPAAPKAAAPAPAPEAQTAPVVPVAPPAPALKQYPPVEKFTRDDLVELKNEYSTLKGVESPTPEQMERKTALSALGKAVNQRIAVEGALPSRGAAPAFDLVKVATALNRVVPFSEPIKLDQAPDALDAEVREALKELQLKDFQKQPDETREVFSTEEAGWIKAMGIKLPAGVDVPRTAAAKGSAPKAPKAPKAAKPPKAPPAPRYTRWTATVDAVKAAKDGIQTPEADIAKASDDLYVKTTGKDSNAKESKTVTAFTMKVLARWTATA